VLSSSFRLRGVRVMCKDNSAAVVSHIMPHRHSQIPLCCLNIAIYMALTRFGVPAGGDRKRSKTDALAEDGTLNPAPEKVRDPKFQEDGFFDPRDIVQVKYEMLRRASVEK